jgi:hypothetical protein
VSDIDRFAYREGMIGMVMDQGRVRVEINLAHAKNVQLGISAKLLKLSSVIYDRQHSMLPIVPRLLCKNLDLKSLSYL